MLSKTRSPFLQPQAYKGKCYLVETAAGIQGYQGGHAPLPRTGRVRGRGSCPCKKSLTIWDPRILKEYVENKNLASHFDDVRVASLLAALFDQFTGNALDICVGEGGGLLRFVLIIWLL